MPTSRFSNNTEFGCRIRKCASDINVSVGNLSLSLRFAKPGLRRARTRCELTASQATLRMDHRRQDTTGMPTRPNAKGSTTSFSTANVMEHAKPSLMARRRPTGVEDDSQMSTCIVSV